MWVKIDDGMATHPKIIKAGPLALAIQVRAICYASQHKTDGYIPKEAIPLLLIGFDQYGVELSKNEHFSTGCQVDEFDWPALMVERGLWDADNEGYTIHDYLEWNVSKKDYEQWKKKLSQSGKKGMKSRWNKRNSRVAEVITKVITNPVTSLSTSTSISSSLKNSDMDDEFWSDLKANPAYRHIDLMVENGKMDAWLALPKNKHRKKTRQFVLNWLNKIDPPLRDTHHIAKGCQERVKRENFLKPCGEPSVTVIGGRPLCQTHKEYHERRATTCTA